MPLSVLYSTTETDLLVSLWDLTASGRHYDPPHISTSVIQVVSILILFIATGTDPLIRLLDSSASIRHRDLTQSSASFQSEELCLDLLLLRLLSSLTCES